MTSAKQSHSWISKMIGHHDFGHFSFVKSRQTLTICSLFSSRNDLLNLFVSFNYVKFFLSNFVKILFEKLDPTALSLNLVLIFFY